MYSGHSYIARIYRQELRTFYQAGHAALGAPESLVKQATQYHDGVSSDVTRDLLLEQCINQGHNTAAGSKMGCC